jgi:hypothetical protein
MSNNPSTAEFNLTHSEKVQYMSRLMSRALAGDRLSFKFQKNSIPQLTDEHSRQLENLFEEIHSVSKNTLQLYCHLLFEIFQQLTCINHVHALEEECIVGLRDHMLEDELRHTHTSTKPSVEAVETLMGPMAQRPSNTGLGIPMGTPEEKHTHIDLQDAFDQLSNLGTRLVIQRRDTLKKLYSLFVEILSDKKAHERKRFAKYLSNQCRTHLHS